MNGWQQKRHFDQIALHTFGRIEQLIEDLARSNQVPAHELTERVAALLQLQTNGSVLGSQDRMPTLPGARAGRDQSLEQMALAGGARVNPQVKKHTRMKGFSYQGKHWTQLPKNKARLRRLAKQRMAERNKAKGQ